MLKLHQRPNCGTWWPFGWNDTFRAFWKNILISNFKPGIEIQSVAAAVLDFAFRQLEPTHQREDYRELLDLTLMFLGRVPPRTWCHSQSTVHVKIDTCICFENRPVQRCWIQANKERNTRSCRLLCFWCSGVHKISVPLSPANCSSCKRFEFVETSRAS